MSRTCLKVRRLLGLLVCLSLPKGLSESKQELKDPNMYEKDNENSFKSNQNYNERRFRNAVNNSPESKVGGSKIKG